MWDDLLSLLGGWYLDFVDSVSQFSVTKVILDSSDTVLQSESSSLDCWSAYVPWEHLIAAVILVTFIVCVFKLLRSVLCKIL